MFGRLRKGALKLLLRLLRPGAKIFGVPRQFFDYLSVRANLGRQHTFTIPVGAVHSGSLLFVRGFLNHEIFQIIGKWILPFWAREGLDPTSRSYLPRALSLIFLNLTHRNWTAIGLPCGERTAIVDPRGLVTPVADTGWSLDTWLMVDGQIHSPSELEGVQQEPIDHLPIVHTICDFKDLRLELETFVSDAGELQVVHRAQVTNRSDAPRSAMLLFAIRPYNPEGISVIHSLRYEADDRWLIDDHAPLVLLEKPDHTYVSRFARSEMRAVVLSGQGGRAIECPHGLANGACGYDLVLQPGESREFGALVPLTPLNKHRSIKAKSAQYIEQARCETTTCWRRALDGTMRIRVPDERLQAAFEANKAYLLAFCHGETITPGPGIYNQFWFRDAAYMLAALDRLGKHQEVERILLTYPSRQTSKGHFFSQEDEWDSTGQAIWNLVNHYRLTSSQAFLHRIYPSIVRGVRWIEQMRRSTQRAGSAHSGLMPPGLSAEHLGPDDYFYWDDLWGAAAEREAAHAAQAVDKVEEAQRFEKSFRAFWSDIEASLARTEKRLKRPAIPASPYRGLDSAMIGGVAAYHPLRLMSIDDPRLVDTLTALDEYCVDGILFHTIAHSGYTTYLNMQLAQCYLARRNLKKAWHIIDWLLEHATPTFTWPEAINPVTFGGVMGDGHHGWAAADFVLLVRALLFDEDGTKLVITPGLPEQWLPEKGQQPQTVSVEEAPGLFGIISYGLTIEAHQAQLELKCRYTTPPVQLEIRWPRELASVGCDGQEVEAHGNTVVVPGDSREIALEFD